MLDLTPKQSAEISVMKAKRFDLDNETLIFLYEVLAGTGEDPYSTVSRFLVLVPFFYYVAKVSANIVYMKAATKFFNK